MMTAERQRVLLEVLKGEGKVLASAMSRRLGVSEDTIRRDLRELDKAGPVATRSRRCLTQAAVFG